MPLGARALVVAAVLAGGSVAIALTAPAAVAILSIAGLAVAAAWIVAGEAGRARRAAIADLSARLRGDLSARLEELQAESALRDQILGAMSEAVILVEGDVVIYANDAARRLVSAAVGKPPPPQIPDDTGPADFEIHHPAHRQMRATTAVLPSGKRVIVAQDVTEARRIDSIRRDFVANASHEMKTPIAGILATAETLQAAIREDPVAAERFAETLMKETQRLSNLIQDLLDLARLDQPKAQDQPTGWSQLVAGAVADARAVASDAGVTLDADIDEGVVVAGRPQDLAQLARNLLDNAIAYTPSGGEVRVRLTTGEDVAELTVTDTGVGIPARDLPRVFERFYRVDRARARDTGGTGLGLSIVRHVAEQHGGSVRADSTLGAGSTFTVTLPLRA